MALQQQRQVRSHRRQQQRQQGPKQWAKRLQLQM
jgi:hypothetical protein